MADQKIIWFQEITDEDKDIAARFGYEAIGSSDNVGIAGGYRGLVDHATGSLFLFLENDWLLIEEPSTQIITGAMLLETNSVDVVRYRHRLVPGAPLWSSQFAGNETSRPEYLLESMHWEKNPDKYTLSDYAYAHQPIKKLPYGWYMTDARFAAWTNNPTMFRTDFIKYLSKKFEGDVEIALSEWWQSSAGFKVAQGDGLFTHHRLDR